jgi:hypothetical protein
MAQVSLGDKGWVVSGAGTYYVICRHPEDVFPEILTQFPDATLQQLQDAAKILLLDDSNPSPLGSKMVVFIWHGTSGLSSISWWRLVLELAPNPDKIWQWVQEVFS